MPAKHFCTFPADIRGATIRLGGHRGDMTDLQRFQRAARVFLPRLLIIHGTDAPEVLRRMADELEWLEAERVTESAGGDLNPPN